MGLRLMVAKKAWPPGLSSPAQARTWLAGIGHVLEHFHAGHHVVAARLLARQLLHGDLAIGDLLAALQQVQLRHLEGLVGQIDPGHLGAARGHALRQDAAAAAHVQHTLACQGAVPVDPVEPQRIDLVQRPELAVGIPPAVRELAEFLQLLRIDVERLAHACGVMRCCQLAAVAASSAASRVVRCRLSSSGWPPTHTWLTCSRAAA